MGRQFISIISTTIKSVRAELLLLLVIQVLTISFSSQAQTSSALSANASSKTPNNALTGLSFCDPNAPSPGCIGIDATGACPTTTPCTPSACGQSCTYTAWGCTGQSEKSITMQVNQIPMYYITYDGTSCGNGRRYPPSGYSTLTILSTTSSSAIGDQINPTLDASSFNKLPGPVTFNSFACVGTTQTVTAPPCAVNGACGSANGSSTSSSAPTSGLCASGTASAVTGTGPWNWTCSGTGGGTTATCAATPTATCPSGQSLTWIRGAQTNGVTCMAAGGKATCGSANGTTVSSAPTSNLCATGTASAVTGTGPWNWNCSLGGSISCSANKTPAYVCQKGDGSAICCPNISGPQPCAAGSNSPAGTVDTCGCTSGPGGAGGTRSQSCELNWKCVNGMTQLVSNCHAGGCF